MTRAPSIRTLSMGITIIIAGGAVASCSVSQESASPVRPGARSASAAAASAQLRKVGDGFDRPVAAVAIPTTRLIAIVEQGGRIAVSSGMYCTRQGVCPAEPVRTGRTMLDMSGRVSTGREQGLLGLAFHPKWPNDPRIFINYTDRSGVTRIEAWMLRTPMTRAVPSSVVTELEQPFANHNGGWLAFGPDSLLYVGTGDGGGAGDPDDRAQASDDRLGKMLRYDVGEGPRGVASPAGGSSDDADPAVWGIGLRNPWRYSFDEASGALWIGDVGQDKREEINVVPRSKFDEVVNFGWRQREGDSPFRSDGGQGSGVTIPPVIDYTRSRGCSVTGGAVYRGKAIKDLVGMYLFADVCEAGIRVVDADAAVRRSRPLRVWSTIAGGAQIVSINVGHSGEVLVVGHGGEIWQIVPRTEP